MKLNPECGAVTFYVPVKAAASVDSAQASKPNIEVDHDPSHILSSIKTRCLPNSGALSESVLQIHRSLSLSLVARAYAESGETEKAPNRNEAVKALEAPAHVWRVLGASGQTFV